MHPRTLLLSVSLHGAAVVGAAVLWGLGPVARPPELRLTVSRPAPDVPAPREEPVPQPVPDAEPFEPPVAEPELPLPPPDPNELAEIEEPETTEGPWPATRPREWTPAALVSLRPKPPEPPPEALPEPQPPAELVRAQLLDSHNEAPRYPTMARRRGYEGVVVLRLHVGVGGEVEKVEIAEPCAYDILNRAAVEAARQWRFAPATRGGEPVTDVVEKTIWFDLEGG